MIEIPTEYEPRYTYSRNDPKLILTFSETPC